jgi:hypothetical protein
VVSCLVYELAPRRDLLPRCKLCRWHPRKAHDTTWPILCRTCLKIFEPRPSTSHRRGRPDSDVPINDDHLLRRPL